MVNVTKGNFLEQSNDFIKHLPNASFISLDEEMTGIMLPPGMAGRPSKDDMPSDRYPAFKQIPERYSMIQLGICLFEAQPQDQAQPSSPSSTNNSNFLVRRYNFTLFPPADASITREVVLNPSSIHFLQQHNMNLDVWTRQGIPFCTGDVATNLLDKYYEKQQKLSETIKTSSSTPRTTSRRVELTRAEDKDFHARAMASLREWLDAAIVPREEDTEGASLLLPPCNSFLRRALYESIPNEYPNLLLETFQESQIRVWRLNAEERVRRQERLLREGWENLLNQKLGMWRVFLALSKACRGETALTRAEHMAMASDAKQAMAAGPLSDRKARKIPLVFHNGLQDVLFLLTHFHSPILPDSWDQCKELIHSYFPIVYDTKTMATEYCIRESSRTHTHLGAVYERAVLNQPRLSQAFTHHNGDGEEQAHEASYDAYMTGAAFCGLSYIIQDQAQHPAVVKSRHSSRFALWDTPEDDEDIAWYYGRNKLHFYLSPYTIDLEIPESDPLGRGMSPESTFRVSDIDPSVNTREIVKCMTGLTDSQDQRINFEIIWVDDATFLVAATLTSIRDPSRYQEHGEIIFRALTERFKGERVQPFVASKDKGPEPSLWNLWGLFASTKKRELVGAEAVHPNKRQRVN